MVQLHHSIFRNIHLNHWNSESFGRKIFLHTWCKKDYILKTLKMVLFSLDSLPLLKRGFIGPKALSGNLRVIGMLNTYEFFPQWYTQCAKEILKVYSGQELKGVFRTNYNLLVF